MRAEERRDIQTSAVATLLYFDVFAHPLTVEETFAFLPRNSISVDDLRTALSSAEEFDHHDGDMLLLRGRPGAWISNRLAKEQYAKTLWRRARIVARFIALFPFVRGLFVTGSLSKNATDPKADIDWFIVAEPGRLWICKTLLTMFRRIVLLNSTKYFCTNYYVSTNALAIPDHNVFVATEIVTARPMLNAAIAQRFIDENKWVKDFLPNFKKPDTSKIIERSGFSVALQRGLEFVFRGRLGDWLEERFMATHIRYQHRKHPELNESQFHLMYRSQKDVCKIHHLNYQTKVLKQYDDVLRKFGILRRIREM